MAYIQSLRPNVTREEAVRQFGGGVAGRLREVLQGPLRLVAEFYIPFRVFEVEISNAGKLDRRILGLDAVTGSLDPYFFAHVPADEEVVGVETRNCLSLSLDLDQARKLVVTKVQRWLFTSGFFRIRNLAISVNPLAGRIYIPYWAGFRGHGASASFAVIDAVRRQPEGSRVRRMLEDWLTTNPASSTAAAQPLMP